MDNLDNNLDNLSKFAILLIAPPLTFCGHISDIFPVIYGIFALSVAPCIYFWYSIRDSYTPCWNVTVPSWLLELVLGLVGLITWTNNCKQPKHLSISQFYYFWLLQASLKPWTYGAISSQTPVIGLNQLKQVHVQMYNINNIKKTALSGSYTYTELKWKIEPNFELNGLRLWNYTKIGKMHWTLADKLNLSTFGELGLQEIPGDYTQASKTNKITGIITRKVLYCTQACSGSHIVEYWVFLNTSLSPCWNK